MSEFDRQDHWQQVYTKKQSTDVSWYQPKPEKSLQLIRASGVALDASIIDVGGGASTLVDHLLDAGYRDVTVLDIAEAAFEQSRHRLGPMSDNVRWIVADVTQFEAERSYDLWHDRAVLHFLTDAEDRENYVAALNRAVGPGGYLVVSSFGPEGPLKCSGLDVRRYDIEMVRELVGETFELQSDELETHTTPGGSTQQFLYSCWKRRG